MARRQLGVWSQGQRLATIEGNRPGEIWLTYSDEALAAYPGNIPLISCSLPLRATRQRAYAYFHGLLPEGQHRAWMASLAGVTTVDVLGLLHRFGRDVAGALVISADSPASASSVAPYTDASLVEAVATLAEHPLGLFDDSELSLAGLQDKMLLVALEHGGWGRPVHGAPSTHILKLDDRLRTGLVGREHACLELAHAAGIAAASSTLTRIADIDCLIVRRFDRCTGVHGVVERVHQEDACQALGIDADLAQGRAKYESAGGPSLRSVAAVLDTYGDSGDLAALLAQVIFTVAIGNADAHGKNIALMHPEPTTVALSPIFDTVPTMMWPKLRDDAALRINGVERLSQVRFGDLVSEASRWPLSRAFASDVVERVVESLRLALEGEVAGMDDALRRAIESRLKGLRRGSSGER